MSVPELRLIHQAIALLNQDPSSGWEPPKPPPPEGLEDLRAERLVSSPDPGP